MGSRIDRLERLDELRRTGALTDAEYEQEKARTLRGTIVDPPQVPVESAAWVATEADDIPALSGIRASWAASPLGRNKPLALAIAIVSALLLGLLLRSLFAAGLWLAVCSAGAYWLYTGLRIEQKPQHEAGTAPWRVSFYVACGLVLISLVLPLKAGHKSDEAATFPGADAASDDAATKGLGDDKQVGVTATPETDGSEQEDVAVERDKQQAARDALATVDSTQRVNRMRGMTESLRDCQAYATDQMAYGECLNQSKAAHGW